VFIYLTLLATNFKIKTRLEVSELPTVSTLLIQIIICLLIEDFAFHMGHRMLHWKMLYGKVHKIHHEYSNPIGISSIYAHPIEHALGNIVPSVLPVALLGSHIHIVTCCVWTIVRITQTVYNHSGYEFPWSPLGILPFRATSTYHEYHHSSNVGNFSGSFILWDTILGSNSVFFKYYYEASAEKAKSK
jgi:sterol desaturase/sphingolipid hydroxylase (fatty acid hydroxylase superfamily)